MQANVQASEPDLQGGFDTIVTREDLGSYLRGLRESRHLTQESLATRTGAMTELKISRSRISEIENAKRDGVAERELRAYLRGLKCTPRHIDQAVTVLARCTATPVREKKYNGQVASSSPSPQLPSRYRWWSHRGAFAIAVVQVVMALTGLGLGYCLRGDSGNRTTPLAGPIVWQVPRTTPLIATDTSNLIKSAIVPDATPGRVNQPSADAPEIRTQLADQENAAGPDATGLITAALAAPCGIEPATQSLPGNLPGLVSAGVGFPSVLSGCRGREILGASSAEVLNRAVSDHRVTPYRSRAGADVVVLLPGGLLGGLGVGLG